MVGKEKKCELTRILTESDVKTLRTLFEKVERSGIQIPQGVTLAHISHEYDCKGCHFRYSFGREAYCSCPGEIKRFSEELQGSPIG